MSYLMESAVEAERLIAQERANPSVPRLVETGLKAGMAAVDVGCGAGEVTASMLSLVGPEGSVTGVEPSRQRLEVARRQLGASKNVTFVEGGLPSTGLPAGRFDYVWCQYVFEYFADPRPALDELVRLARPGGRVVVTDIDGLGLAHWPTTEVIEDGLLLFQRALRRTGFDLFVGRKLFQLFRAAGLTDVRVRAYPFYLVAGRADDRLMEDWRVRFETLAPVATPEFGGEEAYRRFVRAYLELFANDDALKYAIVLSTEGTRR